MAGSVGRLMSTSQETGGTVSERIQVGSASYEIRPEALEAYLGQLLGCSVRLISVRKLGEGFHNAGFLITASTASGIRRTIMRIVRGDTGWGHDYLGDRCGVLLLQHRLFNIAPAGTCSRSLDVAALMGDGSIRSIGGSVEFLHFVEEVSESEWQSYSGDLFAVAERGSLSDADRVRVRAIADYLADLHSVKNPNPNLYMRHVRDLIGHGEMLMGVVDTYPNPDSLGFTSREELEKIETEAVRWRNRIKYLSHRCSRIHGDIHPFGNIRFKKDNTFLALDLSREEFGEPADDIAGLSINYLFFSIWKHGGITPAFKELFNTFLERYLEKTKDVEIFRVMAPFYAFRGTVVAHPLYYPELESTRRRKIFNFILNVLDDEEFKPAKVESYLETEPD